MASAVKSSLWRNLPFNLRGLCSLWVVSELNCRASYNRRTVDIRGLFKRRVNVCECVHKCISVGMNVCVWVGEERGDSGLNWTQGSPPGALRGRAWEGCPAGARGAPGKADSKAGSSTLSPGRS